MGDQRIEARPPLGRIEPRHCLAIGGVGAEPVDRLGRKGDEQACGKRLRRLCDGGIVGAQHARRDFNRRLGRRLCHGRTLVPKWSRRNCTMSAALGGGLPGRNALAISRAGAFSGACRSVAQPGRAPRSGRGGRRFKSCHSDQFLAALSSNSATDPAAGLSSRRLWGGGTARFAMVGSFRDVSAALAPLQQLIFGKIHHRGQRHHHEGDDENKGHDAGYVEASAEGLHQ